MTIIKSDLEYAILEAERFLGRARLLLTQMPGRDEYTSTNPSNAATVRASLDLSMALAKLRQRPRNDGA